MTGATRPVRSRRHPARGLEPAQDFEHRRRRKAERDGGLLGRKRPVGPGIPADHIAERIGDGLEEGAGYAAGRDDAEGVAEPRHVLDRGEHPASAGPHPGGAPVGDELVDPRPDVVGRGPGGEPIAIERPDVPEDVVEPLGRGRPAVLGEVLELELDLGDDLGVEQVAELGVAEQLAQEGTIEGERRRALLGDRRVVLVHEGRDEVEHERRGERARPVERDVGHPDPSGGDVGEDLLEGRQVEVVLEHLAIGLEYDREGAEPPRDLEQIRRLPPLQPERGAATRTAPRQQERPRRRFAEPSREQGGVAYLLEDELLEVVGLDEDRLDGRRLVDVGEAEDDAVVGPDDVDLAAVAVAEPAPGGERPRRMDARPERAEHDDAPVADLIAELLDDDGPVGRQDSGVVDLLGQEAGEVGRGPLVEEVVGV